jgi:MoaA/NifB/PqqE/SkfB family radical SAM enzyme
VLDEGLLTAYNRERRGASTKAVACHAPFTSMNFAQNGDVSVCCYNRAYLLGRYPEATLEEMWLGENARGLREAMSKDPLPRGCEICASQFEARNFEGMRARFYDQFGESYASASGRAPAFPKVMEFELSNVCNLECTMCNGFFSSTIRRNREKLPPLGSPYDEEFVAQLEAFIPHLEAARFLGGEPFLIRIYDQIWDLIARLKPGIEISITTNGTILNDRVKATLERLRAEIIVSIDSLSPELYEEIRLRASFDEVMANLDYLRSYGRRKGTGVTLAVCPMRWNWRDLPHMVDYCDDRGLQVFFNTVVFPQGATFGSMCYTELREVVESLSSQVPRNRTPLERYNAKQYGDLVRQIAAELDRKMKHRGEPRTIPNGEWRLESWEGSEAGLVAGREASDPMRVTIQTLGSGDPWVVRICLDGVSVKTTSQYRVRFRVRADGSRRAWLGLKQSHAPGDELGLYAELELRTSWQRFEIEFSPNRDETDACLFLDLGASLLAVEVGDFVLDSAPSAGAGFSRR